MRLGLLLVGAIVVVSAMFVMMSSPAVDPNPDEEALRALDAAGRRDAVSLVAFRSHGWGGEGHWSRQVEPLEIPAVGGDPIAGLREIHATYYGGFGPGDEMHGALLARLQDNVPRLNDTNNDAAVSFQMLAMDAAGLDATPLRERLVSLAQETEGGLGWGCGLQPGLECTAFALWALAETGGVPADVAAGATAFILSRYDDGPFDDPRLGSGVQVTAWALVGLHAADADVPDASLEWLLGEQGPDGLWVHAGRADPWATADVLFMSSYLATP